MSNVFSVQQRNYLEINMIVNAAVLNAKSFIFIAVLAACAALPAPAEAQDQEVTVRISVPAAGLRLSQAAAAREVYRRLAFAAHIACSTGNRVGLATRVEL
jgi:UrcA family protein